MNWKRILIAVVAGLVVLFLALVIFGEKTLDAGELESDLAEQLAGQAAVDAEQIDVECPDDVKVEEGKTFDCTATLDDETVTVNVELLDDEGQYQARVERSAN